MGEFRSFPYSLTTEVMDGGRQSVEQDDLVRWLLHLDPQAPITAEHRSEAARQVRTSLDIQRDAGINTRSEMALLSR